jgi:hypothetical protein
LYSVANAFVISPKDDIAHSWQHGASCACIKDLQFALHAACRGCVARLPKVMCMVCVIQQKLGTRGAGQRGTERGASDTAVIGRYWRRTTCPPSSVLFQSSLRTHKRMSQVEVAPAPLSVTLAQQNAQRVFSQGGRRGSSRESESLDREPRIPADLHAAAKHQVRRDAC